MKELDQLNQAKNILNQVLSAAGLSMNSNKYVVQEAKSHIRQAIGKLEKLSKKEMLKKAERAKPHQTWINDMNDYYKVGTVSLRKIDDMIKEEKDKLDKLEKQSQSINNNDVILEE